MIKNGGVGSAYEQNKPEPCRCIIGLAGFEAGNQIRGHIDKVVCTVALQTFHMVPDFLFGNFREGAGSA